MNEQFLPLAARIRSVARYLLIAAVVGFISLLFPGHARFQFEFREGQVWHYEDLVAPFDFPVLKPAETVESEIAAIEADFSPYYSFDDRVVKGVLERFENNFQNQLQSLPADGQFENLRRQPERYKKYGQKILASFYRQGIVKLEPEHAEKGKDFVVHIQEANVTHRETVGNLLTPESAESRLTDSLPASPLPDADFLLYVTENIFEPNVFYDDSLTARFKNELLKNIAVTTGLVRKGDVIATEGGLITGEVYRRLVSFKAKYEEEMVESHRPLAVFGGYLLLTALIIGIFLMYLRVNLPDILKNLPKLAFILLWFVVFGYLVFAVENAKGLSSYMIPFCIVPIVVKTFFTDRLAFFTHVVNVLIASFLSSLGYEFTVLQILSGIVAVLTTADTRNWTGFFTAIVFIFLAYTLSFFGLSLIATGDFADIDWQVFGWLFLNAIFTMLAFPLIPLLGKIFGFLTSITLVELSDMNRPLLQELGLKAPGTLQHSLQVGNLAEAAARKIGADQLLVKVGALYHDIGKTNHPEFFIENQSGANPHDQISQLESARIIIGHVTEGAEKAKKARLPKELIDFILTHHGTTRVEYFYRNFIKENPLEKIDEVEFSYPGPKPHTKEQCILMMADSVEAASKSMKNPSGEDIDALVDKIVNSKIQDGQFEESAMTFEELHDCKDVFKKLLRSIHHVRIEYPKDTPPPPADNPV